MKNNKSLKPNSLLSLLSCPTINKRQNYSQLRPLALAVALVFSGSLASKVEADTFTVLNTDDNGPDSLRQAVIDANAHPGDDNIVFAPTLAHSQIILTSGEITSDDDLTITGLNPDEPNSIIIDAAGSSRIFNLTGPGTGNNFTLENITLTGGMANKGGAIYSRYSVLTLNDVVITGNSSVSNGGGINSNFVVPTTLNRSVISDNHIGNAIGGGIISPITVLNQSTISGNSARYGGGIDSGRSVTANQSTISNNHATGGGGGIVADEVHLFQSTLSGNTAGQGGAAWLDFINNFNAAHSSITESTITNNTTSMTGNGAAFDINVGHENDDLTFVNSIFSANTGPEGNIVTSGTDPLTINVTNSLFGDFPDVINGTFQQVYYTDDPSFLGPLKDNGGITQTHIPIPSSPAVNEADDSFITTSFDQRGTGFPRIEGAHADMGSVEHKVIPLSGNNEVMKRGEVAQAILEKLALAPPGFATGLDYHDVQARDQNAAWIAKFKEEAFTEGCENNKFCADMIVTREQMALIYVKAQGLTAPYGSGAIYDDVPMGSFAWDAISAMNTNAWSQGCKIISDPGFPLPTLHFYYCPKQAVTREWFNFLLTKL